MEEQLYKASEQIIPWLLDHGVKIIFIVIGTYIIGRITQKLITNAVRVSVMPDKDNNRESELKREDTLIRIFLSINKIVLILVSSLMVLSEVGIMIGPILAGAGIAGLAVGFGGQYLIRDLITGMFIILENQYRVGDVVNIAGAGGLVEDITLRMTTIRDQDGTVHHIPHGEIKNVSNLTKVFSRVNFNIGVDYSCNLEHVISVINKVGIGLAEDEKYKLSIITPPQFLRVDSFGESSINIKITGDTLPIKQWEVAGALRMRLKAAFDLEGISIPFPQRVVHHVSEKDE
jgi:small-conductance mechanosensitive channel